MRERTRARLASHLQRSRDVMPKYRARTRRAVPLRHSRPRPRPGPVRRYQRPGFGKRSARSGATSIWNGHEQGRKNQNIEAALRRSPSRMTSLPITPIGRRLFSVPVGYNMAEGAPHVIPNEPSCAQWADRAVAKAAISLLPPFQSGIAVGTTYRTTLTIPDLGCVGMTVTCEPAYLAIRLRCASNASYVWLTTKKRRLESNLTQVLGRATYVELEHDAKR